MDSGALFEVSGTVPVNATWQEDIYFTESGAPFDISELDWKMTFRRDNKETSAAYTLSISAGTLSIVDDDDGNSRVLRINVPAGTFDTYGEDFIADLASQDVNDTVQLWAHGIVSFRQNPITF